MLAASRGVVMGREELAGVLERVEYAVRWGLLPMVVFDLDSTLFDTAKRNLRIMREFAEQRGDDFPGMAEHVATIELGEVGWNVLDPLRARGFEPEGLSRAFAPFWTQRFFTNAYVTEDQPSPGAVDYVNLAHAKGALIYYLTGRHVGGMEIGTVEALRNAGFPYFRGRAVLHLKPSFEMDDLSYKGEAIADIRSYNSPVLATFENEPGNANLFLREFPEGVHFLLQTYHSPNAEPPDRALIQVPDFRL